MGETKYLAFSIGRRKNSAFLYVLVEKTLHVFIRSTESLASTYVWLGQRVQVDIDLQALCSAYIIKMLKDHALMKNDQKRAENQFSF